MLSSRTRVRIQRRRAPDAGDHEPEGVTFANLSGPLRKKQGRRARKDTDGPNANMKNYKRWRCHPAAPLLL